MQQLDMRKSNFVSPSAAHIAHKPVISDSVQRQLSLPDERQSKQSVSCAKVACGLKSARKKRTAKDAAIILEQCGDRLPRGKVWVRCGREISDEKISCCSDVLRRCCNKAREIRSLFFVRSWSGRPAWMLGAVSRRELIKKAG